jgi:glycosyltransferase involved in cell wall biosynthesis
VANPVALAAAIRSVLADPVLAGRLAAAGRARVQQAFSIESMIQSTSCLYDELLGAGAKWYSQQLSTGQAYE